MPKPKSLKDALKGQQASALKRAQQARIAEARLRKEASITGKKVVPSKIAEQRGGFPNQASGFVKVDPLETDRQRERERREGKMRKSGKERLEREQREEEKAVSVALGKGKQRMTYPFDKTDTILLIGEGNFSYALSLLLPPHSHPAHLLLATAYDSQQSCYEKYPDAKEKVERILEMGGKVDWEVDARRMERSKSVGKGSKWSRIVFNFPHAGES